MIQEGVCVYACREVEIEVPSAEKLTTKNADLSGDQNLHIKEKIFTNY